MQLLGIAFILNVNPHGAEPANVYEANAKLPTGILKYYGLEN